MFYVPNLSLELSHPGLICTINFVVQIETPAKVRLKTVFIREEKERKLWPPGPKCKTRIHQKINCEIVKSCLFKRVRIHQAVLLKFPLHRGNLIDYFTTCLWNKPETTICNFPLLITNDLSRRSPTDLEPICLELPFLTSQVLKYWNIEILNVLVITLTQPERNLT